MPIPFIYIRNNVLWLILNKKIVFISLNIYNFISFSNKNFIIFSNALESFMKISNLSRQEKFKRL